MKQRKDLEAANQSGHFWEVEDPEIMDTGRNVLRYYPEAQRLVIHLPDWENYKTGKLCPGKGVGLNLYALAESPDICERVIEILQGLLDPAEDPEEAEDE